MVPHVLRLAGLLLLFKRLTRNRLHCAPTGSIFHWLHPSVITSTIQLVPSNNITADRPAWSSAAGRVGLKVGVCEVVGAQATAEPREVQCIQMHGVVGSELSYKDMHNS